jgi:NAD(P)-dependent dehydrogenase (short-subunit alcohol dehydrogenase family)
VDELRFDGRVVAITGAHHGLGREHALLLARRGASVVVNDVQGAAETVAMVRDAGGEAIENTSDITRGVGTDRIVQDALDTWGRLDAIVNNAASGSGTIPDEDMVQHTLGVHFVGSVNLVRSAMPVFRAQRYGRIVNTGSGSILGIPHTGIYAAGKGAVMAFSKVLANELREEREQDPDLDITVNVIMPVAQTPIMPRVPDPEFQALLDHAFAPERTSPLVAVFAHESCPVSGELVQTGGGRVARFVFATTEGWQADDDMPTPEGILEHWDDVMANRDLQEPVGSMMDLFVRRGMYPYGVAEIMRWAHTGEDPARRKV